MRLIRFILTSVVLFTLSTSASASNDFRIRGWKEVVVSVSSLETHINFLETIAGWEIKQQQMVSRVQLDFWQLPDSVIAHEVLMGNTGAETGFIRLVKFEGVRQRQIRSNGRSWDPGGILDINVRILDMEKKFRQLQSAGWYAHSDPVEFSFGPFVVKEWIVVGPDGLSFALIERVAPELEGWPNLREFSRAFNSTQVVANMEIARHFYMEVLGFEKYLYHKGASESVGPNVLGLPNNLTTVFEREVWILHPQGLNEGSVELLAFDGVRGNDFADHARPPNLGLLALRFPVSNIRAFQSHLLQQNIELSSATKDVPLNYYKSTQLLALRAPDGAWLEFFE